ncbi:sugar kinase [Alginatibacterium sediminis]|uniref:2-dehydro-3-deoxygluconokinase n=1 Tax=Alginatibacterium sediminis TaxID=2164068 RepID=A0A420ELL7_9ALTE|nr:sugar kinase [Alginatibacterium sediminis]RKF21540.1 sugar kinase [Alginatibacterium sediminis]
MTTNPKVAIIGECMIELSENKGQVARRFGGDTLNTAVYLSRLSAFSPYYVSALGDNDPFSQEMVDAWNSEGVDTSLIQRLPNYLPGLYYIDVDESGERSFFYWREQAAAKFWLDQDCSEDTLAQLMTMDWIYLSGISIAILSDESREKFFTWLAAFRANGGKVAFDNNYRPRLWQSKEHAQVAYRHMMGLCDLAILTFDDEQDLFGTDTPQTCIDNSHQSGVNEVVIKQGSNPCQISYPEHFLSVAAQKITNVVDTTAAGDSFSAGYLAGRLAGKDPQASAEIAHRVAGTVIQHRGAIIDQQFMPQIG